MDISIPSEGLSHSLEYEGSILDILFGFSAIYEKYKDKVCFLSDDDKLVTIEWADEELNIPDNIWELMEKCNSRIIAVPVILYYTYHKYSHMTILIYDKRRLEMQRYDPNGMSQEYNEFILDEKLKFEFWDNLNSAINYIKPDNTCPVQLYQSKYFTDENDEGYCSAWCFWYLELRLMNLDIDPYKVEQLAYDELRKKDISLLEFIRGYTNFLLNIKHQLVDNLTRQNIEVNDYTLHSRLSEYLPFSISNLIKNLDIK
jgi:hypothetical protein